MRNDVVAKGWKVSTTQDAFADDFRESVFFTGNGRMGVRGYCAAEPEPRPIQKGLFVAGMFAEIKPGITDFVNLPTPVYAAVTINGKSAQLASVIQKELDLSCGLLTQEYTLSADGCHAVIREQRFFPHEHPSYLVQRLQIEVDQPCEITVESAIQLSCCNCPVPDDQVKENHETVCLMNELSHSICGEEAEISFVAKGTGLHLAETLHCNAPASCSRQPVYNPAHAIGFLHTAHAKPGSTYSFDSFCRIKTSRDADPLLESAPSVFDYDRMLADSRLAWADIWSRCDIAIDGDASAEAALRYTIYQLLANCSARDSSVNIGARGLTHTRYKGCYFWDTDLFMMPFYLYELPQAAKSLETYRLNTLPSAIKNAARMNNAGARYPWMASFDGSEQCESWDIGASELHITADVVYAMHLYAETAADSFFAKKARAVYIETARFWASRYSPDPEKPNTYNLLFCKGPDEYCGITSNNLYTNVMVRHNLQLAIDAALSLRGEGSTEDIDLPDEAEIARWRALRDGIEIPRDPSNGHLRTDDTFHLLEKVNPHCLKSDDSASYHSVCFDRLQRYQVVKQADVLLLMTRFPTLFSDAEKLAAWQDFEPLCLHDSTLSFASHAYFAAENGLMEKAQSYFTKALFLDLREVMGNTGKEGLHLANFGETWQAVIFGFAGLTFEPSGPALHPHLPAGWNGLHFHFYWHGTLYQADIVKGGICQVCPK